MRVLILFLLVSLLANAIYLPGVAPKKYHNGHEVELKAASITSSKTQLPYKFYSLPLCPPAEEENKSENLGEVLSGERVTNSNYKIRFLIDEMEQELCVQQLDDKQRDTLRKRIKEEYYGHWIIDNLPVATVKEMTDGSTIYEDGFPIGRYDVETDAYKLCTQHDLQISYHPDDDGDGAMIVGATVACERRVEISPTTAQFTMYYNVKWVESDIKWSSRWDHYLKIQNSQIHWFTIVNSLIVVFFLTFMVGTILLRTLHQDLIRYNTIDLQEEIQEESGWKLVHGDVMRPPKNPMLLSVLVGSGLQVLLSSCVTLVFAVFGFLSPANRGALLTSCLVLFVFMGVFAGYGSARLYKNMQGRSWKKNAAWTAYLFPGVCFGTFFVLNFFIWHEKSSGAVPFPVLIGLTAMWVCVHVPLTLLGCYMGNNKDLSRHPVRTNQIPRQIPPQPWYNSTSLIMLGGVLPFVAAFFELRFILDSVWQHQMMYIFGFFFLVFVILAITSAEISVVMVYFQLCSEDYHWWWRSFLTSGSAAFYMFGYSIFYFANSLHITKFVSALLFFGYMFILSFAFFCMTGAFGFYATYYFVWKIYGDVKVD